MFHFTLMNINPQQSPDCESENRHGKLRVCYGTVNVPLGQKIQEIIAKKENGTRNATLNIKKFADGELCAEFSDTIRGCDVFIVNPISTPDVNAALMEMLLAVDAARRAAAARIIAIIPYYGYARQDRKARPRQPISARVVADMLTTAGVDHVVSLDIHTQQIQGFFGSRVPLDFLPGDAVFLEELAKLYKENPFVVASTDAGGAARCRDLAAKFNADLVIMDKRRPKDNVSEVMNVIGDVKGKNVLIYDDLCDTAGSLCKAAEALKKNGALKIFGCVTHAVLSEPAAQRIKESVFDKVYFSDSINIPEHKMELIKEKVVVVSAAPLLAKCIECIHYEQSTMQYMADIKKNVSCILGNE